MIYRTPLFQATAEQRSSDAAELDRLKREVAQRDDILSMAAHELRNPLHALALHLALARATAQSHAQGDVAERVRKAELTLKRYTERVTVLMDLLSSPADTYPLHPRQVDLGGLLTSLVESLEQEARLRQIELRLDMDSGSPWWIDPVALEQVVDNLVLNAFKHSGASVVTVRLRYEPKAATIEIEDNGRGIAAEDKHMIFAKFAVAAHSPRGSGSGLGLWIVTRLVKALKGEINLLDVPGGGCVFALRIPENDDSSNSR